MTVKPSNDIKKIKNIKMKTKKRYLVILIALLLGLLGRGRANAQTTSWDGTQKSGTYWLDTDITLSSSFGIEGDLTLVSRGSHTIKRTGGSWMFGTSSHKLTIYTQNATDTVYLDGGSVFTDNDARKACTAQSVQGNLIWVASKGSIDLTNVVLQNQRNSSSYKWGGAIASDARTEGTPTSIVLTNCKIRACYTETGGSAIFFDNRELHNVTLTNVEIYKCKSETGGTIHTATGGVDVALTIEGGKIHDNESGLYGGGICWFAGRSNNSKLIIKEGTKIYNNIARNNGGGIFGSGYIDIQNAEIYDNQATGEAEIPFDYDQPQYTGSSGGVAQYSTTLTTLYSKGCGGGIFIYPYSGTHTAGMSWYYTSAENYNGQGIYFRVGSNVSIHHNTAANKGGGICIELFGNDFTGYVNNNSNNAVYTGTATPYWSNPFYICDAMVSGTLYENSAPQGGGAYIRDYCPKWYRHTKAIAEDPQYHQTSPGWTGLLIRNIDFNGATIRNNHATTDDGGGVYVLKSIRMQTETVNSNWEAAHTFCYGWYNNGTSTGWNSNWGSQLTSVWFRNGTKIYENDAIGYGGGVFVNDNTHDLYTTFPANHHCQIHLNDAIIRDNVCGNHGGGMHLHTGQLIIDGNTTITGNRVSTNGKLGGGIYFAPATDRTLTSTMSLGTASMTVKGNTANTIPNNIYLPTSMTMYMVESYTFTPIYVGVYTQGDEDQIPIISGYVSGVSDGLTKIHDDKQKYVVTKPDIYYFSTGTPWSPLQQTVNTLPAKVNNVYQIGTVEELTAFLWLVNNIDTHHNFNEDLEEDETTHPDASAKLTADIDMEGHYWMPIANYTGTFDGNGYIISNLSMVPTNASEERGLFGVNSSGTIKNVNLRDCYFASAGSYMGSIVSQMNGGTLSNSVAQCQLTATANTCKAGGLVGHINGGTVHSSIATCEMTGYTMGGLAGEISSSGNLYNSFANPKFNYTGGSGANAKFVGGLVAENSGTVANCYVRFSRPQSLTDAKFGQLAGSIGTGGSVSNCYTPSTFTSDVPPAIVSSGNATASYTYEIADAPYLYTRSSDNKVTGLGTTLTKALNGWVDRHQNQGYASWNRSTAGGYSYTYDDGRGDVTVTGGNINDDYPLPKMQGLCCAASPDGLTIEYKKSLDDMIIKYNGLSGGGTIWLYDSPKEDDGSDEYVSETNDGDVLLYIDEDASLLQSYDPENTSSNNTLTAYTGQTLKTYSANSGNRWHLFSSPLQESQIGISYTDDGVVGFSWASDPCGVKFSQDNDNALFPSDMPVAAFDLYSFYEPEYHWINFRRNTLSHWHENAHEVKINYNGNGINTSVAPYNSGDYSNDGNEPILVPGKGYLVSINQEQLVQNKGVLNNGNVVVCNVTKTDFNAWAERLGFNLLGNPYQSYLDFEKFVNADIDPSEATAKNADNLWTGGADDTYANTYATYDPSQKAYVQYTQNPSQGANTASQYIHPHQGFFVRMTNGTENTNTTTVTYTNAMRTNATDDQSGFRSGESQPAYPLVNFTVRDGEGNADVAVLEIGRPADEGAPKMRLGDCAGVLSLGHEGKDYGILFRTEVEDYQPLRFEATEAGTFTLTWNTANADFERLTLIDNIAGTETDMLVRDSYRFEATADQYASRFKVVIGDYKGVDEPEPAEGPAESFAFQMGDQLVVNGEGNLQVVDMLGRVVMTECLTSSQNMVGLPKAAGVYVLRLTDGGGTRTQKMVVGL